MMKINMKKKTKFTSKMTTPKKPMEKAMKMSCTTSMMIKERKLNNMPLNLLKRASVPQLMDLLFLPFSLKEVD